MNPMKRRQDQMSGSVLENSTASEASKSNAFAQHERHPQRARTEGISETNTVGSNSQGNHVIPNAPVLSARAQKRAKVVGEIGSDDKAKGLVRTGSNGLLEHSSDEAKTWVAAVYHNDLRVELIQEAAQFGQYDHARNRGAGPTDITSFLASQKSWGPERKHWPDVLFQIEVNKNTGLPKTVPHWHRNGRLVIDHDNHPMRDFLGLLPATLSSEAEGWLLETFTRTDPRVQIKDLRGRMPKEIVITDKNGVAGNIQQTKPLFTPRTITQRTLRFRGHAGLKARDVRGGSDVINKGLDALIPAEALKTNNTKELGRLLTSEEIEAFKKPNEGKYPQRGRAGKGVLCGSSKRKRNEKDIQGEGSKEINKRARVLENAALLGGGSVLTRGAGLGMPTPGSQELSSPEDLGYLPLDTALFPQEEAAFQQWLLHDTAQPLAPPQESDKWENLLHLRPQEAYNLMNAGTHESRGWNEDVNRTYGPVSNDQSYQPYATHVGRAADHRRGSTIYSAHGQLHQVPEVAEEQYHGHNSEGAWNQDARVGSDVRYTQAYHTSVANRATNTSIEEETLYPNVYASIYPSHGHIHQPSALHPPAEESSYPEFEARIPIVYSQVPTAATAGYDHGYGTGGSPVESTLTGTDTSLPSTEPTTPPSATNFRTRKGKAQQYGNTLIDACSTHPAVGCPCDSNEQQTVCWADVPSMPMGSYSKSNAIYDGTPVYYSNAQYHGGGSVEPLGQVHQGAETGRLAEVHRQSDVATPTASESVDPSVPAIEEWLREAEYLRR